MKRMLFERPTDHYDERVIAIDEQLCRLLKDRKEISGGHAGFPPLEWVEQRARELGLYEDFLKSVFGLLMNESVFRPVVEPEGFRKYIPVLLSQELGGELYTLASVRQYVNASAVTMHVDASETSASLEMRIRTFYELEVGAGYDCRKADGGSSGSHLFQEYIVSPALPDDLTGVTFHFTAHAKPFQKEPIEKTISFTV
ncbi:hypothetical protein SAMN05216312_104316 [Cohnella sp. OV330]|uniref:chorismate mutase n=1 Tax=Cohnella sp. OV330 TaxID=1855288 RepID=UPI0008E9EDE8|nr:chorismate mutase [Cohnella sp. OV330]SFB18837.1 hypothetical protein SAMN05216312_104316 [Cohnella sp. OV330]